MVAFGGDKNIEFRVTADTEPAKKSFASLGKTFSSTVDGIKKETADITKSLKSSDIAAVALGTAIGGALGGLAVSAVKNLAGALVGLPGLLIDIAEQGDKFGDIQE